ncbi:MAG: type II toxin-antitoxin system PemK/MazF family toxin [Fusobacteriaceae bacterium]
MNVEIFGVYLADFKKNIGGEINNQRYCIAISELSSKDNTLLVVPITGKKSGTKYRGGFTIDNTKYQSEPKYEKCFAKVRKIREIDKSRIKGNSIFKLDEYDQEQLREAIQKVIKINICK